MTPEVINIAIAKEVAWKCDPAWFTTQTPPNYFNDLNEIHEAILGESEHVQALIVQEIWKLNPEISSTLSLLNATARHLSEAFLRAKGLWEEDV